mmetsp:Transcript_34174/g.91186  ORF Transcript_34174/g.91186 Transcript_34174/m.91186 type:complete len:212 (-) Transcript_34174:220-855(-)
MSLAVLALFTPVMLSPGQIRCSACAAFHSGTSPRLKTARTTTRSVSSSITALMPNLFPSGPLRRSCTLNDGGLGWIEKFMGTPVWAAISALATNSDEVHGAPSTATTTSPVSTTKPPSPDAPASAPVASSVDTTRPPSGRSTKLAPNRPFGRKVTMTLRLGLSSRVATSTTGTYRSGALLIAVSRGTLSCPGLSIVVKFSNGSLVFARMGI